MDVSAVGGYSVEFTATPTVSNGVAYTSGDQVGGIIEIFSKDNGNRVTTGPCQAQACASTLTSLVILDKSSQNAAFSIFFFNALPTVASVDNGAMTITDAEMAKCIGVVRVAAGDYDTVASSSIATLRAPSASLALMSQTDNGPLWAVVKTTSTPTYTSTTDLVFRFLFSQDVGA